MFFMHVLFATPTDIAKNYNPQAAVKFGNE